MLIYKKIEGFLGQKLLQKATELVNSVLKDSLASYTDKELQSKALQLKEKVAVEVHPDWSCAKEGLCLFEALKQTSSLKIDPTRFHDALCPIVVHYRDSGELFHRTNLSELLQRYER